MDGEHSFGLILSPAVLDSDHISLPGKDERIAILSFVISILIVGGAYENDRKFLLYSFRKIEVSGQSYAIPHRNHDTPLHTNIVFWLRKRIF
jgi:hypothetical protein